MTSKKTADAGNIQTFLRIRPSKKSSGYFSQDELDQDSLKFNIPDSIKADFINNSKLHYGFHFNGVIPMEATQEDVFKKVGTAAVQNALDGFNSTIFAYGQTGSGKTFTLTGGPEKYSDRGIIPRAISMLYNEFRTRTDVQSKAYISYLELYNEQGYDLLDPTHETKALEEMPKVTMLEDENGNFHLKNLSMHVADTEEDALNLLFMGDTNRAIAETPMNMASSRSHCIFSISLESRIAGSDKVRRSKLHLVDLAGSERVGKTNSTGSVLTEAKYINSSLFFLEMVIVALHEKATKGRSHVPYRNSMMTSVLRDSLGGNCKTIMIATINPEAPQTEESLSTCRFAQRVSLIKNKASINEDQDPSLVIRRLKSEVLNLREEIAFLKGEAGEGDALSPQEIEDLKVKTRAYCEDKDPNSILNIGSLTLTKIKDVFTILKNLVMESQSEASEAGSRGRKIESSEANEDLQRQLDDVKACLLQRDNEIAILVNMVKKGKTADDVGSASRGVSRSSTSIENNSSSNSNGYKDINSSPHQEREVNRSNGPNAKTYLQQQQQQQKDREEATKELIVKRHLFGVPPPTDKAIFEDAAASFEWFKDKCSMNAAMEENRDTLRDKITEAKTMGERANQSRSTITYLKNSIEAIRRERALTRFDSDKKEDDEVEVVEETNDEKTYRRAIEQEKTVYKESFERLKVLKPEIEHVRKLLDKGRVNLQNQFDQWYSNLHSREGLIGGNSNHESAYNNSDEKSKSNIKSDYKDININEHKQVNTTRESLNSGLSVAERKSTSDDVNEDIQAFYQAKDELLKRRGH